MRQFPVLEDRTRQLARASDRLDFLVEQREGLGNEPPIWARGERAGWREEASFLDGQLEDARDTVAQRRAEAEAMASVEHAARAECAVAEHLIEERRSRRLAAVRIDPPGYIVAELEQRPSDPVKRRIWDQAAAGIEGYRLEHGIRDRGSTFGAEHGHKVGGQDHAREQAERRLRESQQQLGRGKQLTAERDLGVGLSIGD